MPDAKTDHDKIVAKYDHDAKVTPKGSTGKLIAGALVGAVAIGAAMAGSAEKKRRDDLADRPRDDGPPRASRRPGTKPSGATVTINAPRAELYAFWRDFPKLAAVMATVDKITVAGKLTTWQIAGPAGTTLTLISEITADVRNERIAWAATKDSQIGGDGRVTFRDAPKGKGTIVDLSATWTPPGGVLGKAAAKVTGNDPSLQARHDLRRLKMLFETGEIATAARRRADVK